MPTEYFLAHIWMIPLFPLAGAALMLFIGRRLPNSAVNVVCVGSVFLSMCFAFGAIWQLIARPVADRVVSFNLFDWVPAGVMHTNAGRVMNFNVPWGVLMDPLTAVMLLVVTGVGFLIHVYSTGYMAHEGGYYRFFGYLNLFMFSMLTLVLANNLLLLFVGWEGVGLCSYLLIGFYFLRKSASDLPSRPATTRTKEAALIYQWRRQTTATQSPSASRSPLRSFPPRSPVPTR